MRKRFLIVVIYFILFIPIIVVGANNSRVISEDMEEKNKMKLEVEINDIYFSVPSTLKEVIAKGWKISDREPYFLKPLIGEDYYEMRTNWSLSKDKKSIAKGGRIIRLLEKDGVLLEVTIANQNIDEDDEPFQKIEEGIVDSIVIFYDKTHSSIKLNGIELKELTPDIILKNYPVNEGWEHIPTNYRNHPEFETSLEYTVMKIVGNSEESITIYFDLDNRAYKVEILNQVTSI